MSEKIFLGLDIGTDSVGWAVTNEQFRLKKFHGEPMWGSVMFEAGKQKAERRAFRTARRRLERRKQRIILLQELFAEEIGRTDPNFYKRIQESALYREEAGEPFSLFNDSNYTDKEYHRNYPTIHHLIFELMESSEPHDVRLVYLACAWLLAHRGHFLSEVNKESIDQIKEFKPIYEDLKLYICALSDEYVIPWDNEEAFEQILPRKQSVSKKYKELVSALFVDGIIPKTSSESSPVKWEILLKALCGSKISAKDLFWDNEAYTEIDSFSLGTEDDVLAAIIAELGEDGELINKMKAIYDWSVLIDVLGGKGSVSEAKIAVYEQHKKDLKQLKYLIKTYLSEHYNEVFRSDTENTYSAYVKHLSGKDCIPKKWTDQEGFLDYLKKVLSKIEVSESDKTSYEELMRRIEDKSFLPRQKDTDNRVIPFQLYWYELSRLLSRASQYLPFLNDRDETGLSVSEKILSIFSFRIPYFVGPLNKHSKHGWIERKAEGKIYPWTFKKLVDLDKSEDAFIRKMVNNCTYLGGEKCVPKESLLYRKYMVLNEINNIRINEVRIPVELKQRIYEELFCQSRKVTRKKLEEQLCIWGILHKKGKEYEETLSGIDIQINASLKSYHDFKRFLQSGLLTEKDVEAIIERITYSEEKERLAKWITENYPQLSKDDVRYISRLKYKDFGRFSYAFLNRLEGVEADGGEVFTVVAALWNTQYNLMELLSDRFSFQESIRQHNEAYYQENPRTLEKRLEEMYISNAVKRPVLRALEVVKEVKKAVGQAPDKIFIEMARGASESQKNKRTVSRRNQILELYKKCRDEDVRLLKQQLENTTDNRLQSDRLFLYFMQLGRSAYSGKAIDIEQLGTKLYDVDHIYPQRMVKDDSILNNKVLCLSEENGNKTDRYPVPRAWREAMQGFWRELKDKGLMTEEKYKRLTRESGFTADEKIGFINRQLTETSQSTKAVATLLKEFYPDTEVVYVKARLTSEFRNHFDILKSRTVNDLHHAKDAYLNIVTGHVYDMKFSKRWFSVNQEYSLNTKAIFSDKAWSAANGEQVWGGSPMIEMIKRTVAKNQGHLTQYAFCRHGGYFDQMPVKKGAGLIPRKKGLDTEAYGGYNKAAASFFLLVKYQAGKEKDLIFVPVELVHAEKVMQNETNAVAYVKEQIGMIRNKVVEEISFPLGLRRIKINTIIEMDGFRASISGKSGGGKQLVASGINALSLLQIWQNYIVHLDNYVEKCKQNKNLVYDKEHDKINPDKNIELYDLLTEKLRNTVFSKRNNNPITIIMEGRDRFIGLEINEQAKALQSLIMLFSRISGGVDLSLIGGKSRAAATFPSSTLSAWAKNYSDVRVIDTSTTGLWEKRSPNLLELL